MPVATDQPAAQIATGKQLPGRGRSPGARQPWWSRGGWPSGSWRPTRYPEPAEALSRRRRALVWTLVVLASLIALASILTTWVHRQMLDEQAWERRAPS